MNTNDVLNEIINSLQPEEIPPEFIILAKIKDFNGKESVLKGKDLLDFLTNPEKYDHVEEARIILDVNKIKMAILLEVNDFFKELEFPKDFGGEE